VRGLGAVLLVVAMCGAAAAQQAPGPVGAPSGPWRDQIHWVPMTDAAGARHLLYARVCRPPGETPARVVILAHGSPPSESARPGMAPSACDSEAVRWFLERGYMVIAAMRRGYGATGGIDVEAVGICNQQEYARIGLESARDIAATVEYAAALPYARPQGMVLVGQSAGGWATLAYDSLPHPRVTAFVNMAGGRGGHEHNQANRNCRPDQLEAAAGQYGRSATTPMIWIYAANDSFFAPEIAAAMYAQFAQNGGRAEFYQLGGYGPDGHRLFFGVGGSAIWGPLVDRYLATRPAQ